MNFIKPEWPAPDRIKAYTTLRNNWDKEKIQSLLHLPEQPIWLTQTHSATVIEAAMNHMYANADAAFTTHPNRICVVLTADCLPILICNKQGTQVAAILTPVGVD